MFDQFDAQAVRQVLLNALRLVRVAVFFLGCVIVAGLYGGFTVSKQIILKQALPAIIALLLVFFS